MKPTSLNMSMGVLELLEKRTQGKSVYLRVGVGTGIGASFADAMSLSK